MNAKLNTTSSWHERARSLHFRTQAFIDGRYVDAASGQTFDSINPSNGAVLARVAACDVEDVILHNREELALLETLDMGKPISDSLNIDIPGSANCIRWYAEAIDKVYDEVAPTGRDTLALITREPMGVVGAIVPWNFPLLMAAWKIGPVLASGNSLV